MKKVRRNLWLVILCVTAFVVIFAFTIAMSGCSGGNGGSTDIENPDGSNDEEDDEKVKIIFDADGGESPIPFKLVEVDTVAGELPMPVKEGYLFLGWIDTRYSTPRDFNENSYVGYIDITLKATWISEADAFDCSAQIDGFELEDDVFSCTVASNTGTLDLNGAITINKNAKYEFSSDEDGNSPVSLSRIRLTSGENVFYLRVKAFDNVREKLYKINIYRVKTYQVSFYIYKDSKFNDVVKSYTVDENTCVQAPQIDDRTGYTFVKWVYQYGESEGQEWNPDEVIAEDTYIIAEWVPDEYKVVLDSRGGNEVEDVVVQYDKYYTLPVPEKTGYNFMGWYNAQNVKSTDSNGRSTNSWIYMSDMTFHAKWETIIYNINYYLEDGVENSNPLTYTVEDEIELVPPVKTDFEFYGWYLDDGLTKAFDGIITAGSTGDLELYAKFGINRVFTAEQLAEVHGGGEYILMNDIDLSEVSDWSAVCATEQEAFTGTFDGQGYSINYLRVPATNTKNLLGLFGYNKGVIKNVNLVQVYITPSKALSGIATRAAGALAVYNYGTVTNCTATGSISLYGCTGSYAGGLIAYNYGNIEKSMTNVVLYTGSSATTIPGAVSSAGGLVYLNAKDALITDCYSNSTISTYANYTGAESSARSTSFASGLVVRNDGKIENCYATGDVSANGNTSNLRGYAGGLVAYSVGGTVINCFATGNINITARSGQSYYGGLIGRQDSGSASTIINCYRYESQRIIYNNPGEDKSGTETALDNLKNEEFITNILGWSSEVWISGNDGLPVLR